MGGQTASIEEWSQISPGPSQNSPGQTKSEEGGVWRRLEFLPVELKGRPVGVAAQGVKKRVAKTGLGVERGDKSERVYTQVRISRRGR